MTSLGTPENPVLPKVFLQAHELMLNAFAFDLKRQVSEAHDLYMQATKLYAILFKKFPHVAYPDIWRRGAGLYFSRAKQIFAYQAKGKLPHLKGVASKSNSIDQEEDLKESLWRTRITPDPKLRWSDLFGLDQAKKEVEKVVLLPLHHPELLEGRLRLVS